MRSVRFMFRIAFLALLPLTLQIFPAYAQPSVATNGVVNSASYSPVGAPNSGIAQGSIFTVFGTGLGGAAQSITAYPIAKTLGGTSVQITSGSTETNAIPLFVSAGQLAAILPSTVPVGLASLTVTYNGQTSLPAPFQIVQSSFGLYSLNAQGSGEGIITDSQYAVFGPTYSANAGDVVTLWGTGLGPVSGDEAAGPLPGNLSSLPVQVWVGTQSAPIAYQGRSGCCAGLDQIAFTVPAGTTGCYVPLAVQIGNVVSNFGSLAIASGSRTCVDPNLPMLSTLLQQWSQAGSLSVGSLSLVRSYYPGAGNQPASTFDSAIGNFDSLSSSLISSGPPLSDFPPIGTCGVFPSFPATGRFPQALNAGPSLSITGSAGVVPVTITDNGEYATATDFGAPLFLEPGVITVSGPGGTAVGAFSVSVNMPAPFTWTNAATIGTITESQGQLITWTGVDPSNRIQIQGYSQQAGVGPGVSFTCSAAASAGQFQIPAFVLLSMPAVAQQSQSFVGTLAVSAETPPALFTAPGIDLGYATATYSIGNSSVTFK